MPKLLIEGEIRVEPPHEPADVAMEQVRAVREGLISMTHPVFKQCVRTVLGVIDLIGMGWPGSAKTITSSTPRAHPLRPGSRAVCAPVSGHEKLPIAGHESAH